MKPDDNTGTGLDMELKNESERSSRQVVDEMSGNDDDDDNDDGDDDIDDDDDDGDNDNHDNGDDDDGNESNMDGEVNSRTSLRATSRSSVDDEDAMDDDAASQSNGKDHAAYHLPTNLEIREGVEYQCPVLDWSGEDGYYDDTERETCVWRPTTVLKATEIDDYLSIALSCFNIEQDRAMFILQSSDYNIEEAKHQLAKRRIKKEPWSEEDINLFKQGLRTYGKHFGKIKQLLPHKSIKEIINFYYDSKKKLKFRSIIDAFLEENAPGPSSSDEEVNASEKKRGNCCYNCEQTRNLRQMNGLKLCYGCLTHFRNHRRHRPCIKPMSYGTSTFQNVKCPKGMAEVVERFVEFVTEQEIAAMQPTTSEKKDDNIKVEDDEDLEVVEVIQSPEVRYGRILKELERDEMLARGNCVRLEHKLRIQHERELSEDLERYRLSRPSSSTVSSRPRHCLSWSYKEKWQALYAFQRYGKDFNAVSQVIESKTPDMVKAFYYRMHEEIDEIVNKTNDYYRKLASTYDFERKVEVETPSEVIDID